MSDQKLILVVEDDESVRNLVTRALRAAQYDVREAPRAEVAKETLKTMRIPDLILCDVMMPGMAGTDFIRTLKQDAKFKNVPVIFLTAKTGPLDVITGVNAGARHYVTKPFQMKELLEKVAKAIK